MSTPASEQSARALWQGQAVQVRHFSNEEIMDMQSKFNRQIVMRNRREYAGAAVALVGSGWLAWHADSSGTRYGFVLLAAGVAWMVRELHARGGVRVQLAELAAQSCRDYHRAELQRQHALLRGVWRWYLGPMLPGLLVLYADFARGAAGHGLARLLSVALSALITGAVFLFIARLNRKAARRLEEQLEALDARVSRAAP